MTDTELQGETREEPLASTPKSPIPIDDEAFEGIADLFCDGFEHRLPGLGGFFRGKAGHGDVLGSGVSTEQKRMMFAFNVDRFAVKQEIAAPRRLKFLGDLHKALGVFSQGIDPLKEPVGTHVEFTPHRSVGGLPIEVQMSGAQDEARFIPHMARGCLVRCGECLLTVMTPPSLNLACAQPLSGSRLDEVGSMSLGMKSTTCWATFFSSLSPPMECVHIIERQEMSKTTFMSDGYESSGCITSNNYWTRYRVL